MTERARGRDGACYSVLVGATSPSILTWTLRGADQTFPLPLRKQRLVIAGYDRADAEERARVLGRAIMGGRDVLVLDVELRCPPGIHRTDAPPRPDVLVEDDVRRKQRRREVARHTVEPAGWDWLTTTRTGR